MLLYYAALHYITGCDVKYHDKYAVSLQIKLGSL